MGRIEISLEEYNLLKQQAKERNRIAEECRQKISLKDDVIFTLKQELESIINDTSVFDRVFNWKEITSEAIDVINVNCPKDK